MKEGEVIIQGSRNMENGLWQLQDKTRPVLHPPMHQANGIINSRTTKQQLAKYLHACAFSPTISTWKQAIKKGHFASWPGLTTELLDKHYQMDDETAMGHMTAKRRSKSNPTIFVHDDPFIPDMHPHQEENNNATHNIFTTMWETTERTYSDQTGAFPIKSSRGNKYIFIMYSYDANAILVEPIKNRHAKTITEAWIKCYKQLNMSGYAPQLHIIDNEFSTILREAFQKYQVRFQTVAPYKHRVNAAERAIQTFKSHFKSGLASCDPEFPATEWDRLLKQAELTINLLRSSRRQPHLSAYEAVWDKFDFIRTPLAPPGTRAIVYEPTQKRKSFGYNGKVGWYIGPALTKYKHYTFYIPSTYREQEADSMEWKPKKIVFPNTTTEDYLKQAFTDISTILQQVPKLRDIQLEYGDTTNNAWVKLADILKQATDKPQQPPTEVPASVQRVSEPTAPAENAEEQRVPAKKSLHQPAAAPPSSNLQYDTDYDDEDDDDDDDCTVQTSNKKTSHAPTQNLYQKYYPPSTRRRRLSYRAQAIAHLAQQEDCKMYHIYSEHGKRVSYDKLIKGEDKERWLRSSANEFGRLMQGVGKHSRTPTEYVQGTDTMKIITKQQVPAGKPVTYGNFVCDYRPLKEERWRTRLTVGGDKLAYDEDATAPSSQLTDAKLLFNSVISDHKKTGAKFATADIKNFYLNNPLQHFQYMKIHISKIPPEIQHEYNTASSADENGHVYFEIRKGMYGLKEAGIVAWKELVQHLKKYGYEPMRLTTGMWKHSTKPTIFTLTVDDFGIKYCAEADLQHLLDALRDKYTITVDKEGTQYCGMTLEWHYNEGFVDVSMPGYVKEALHQLQHTTPSKPTHAPHQWRIIQYGRKEQQPNEDDTSPPLGPEGTKRIQRITGKFLYYARAIDHTMLVALNELGRQQANPTEKTREAANMLLDYAATHPDAKLRFMASDMILHIDTDAAFLVQPKAKSRVAGYYFMGSKIIRNGIPETTLNAPVLVEVKTLRYTVGSAAEAEIGGIYNGGQTAVPIRQALEEMQHPQPATPLKTDNSTAQGILTATMRPKMSKSIDKNYWWMKDKIKQGEFNLYWKSGRENWADYFTKHHPPAHHKMMRKKYLVANAIRTINGLRGCVAMQGQGGNQTNTDTHHGITTLAHTVAQSMAQNHTVPRLNRSQTT